MAAVVHHGGSGTTGAGLRAGVPTVITPFAADQPFWAQRVEQLGVGVRGERLSRFTPAGLADAIERAVSDPELRARAAALGADGYAEGGADHTAAMIGRAIA